jgi:hypothetical protein
MTRRLAQLLAISFIASMLLLTCAKTTVAINYTTLDDPLAGPGATFANGISGGNIVGSYYDASGLGHGFLFNGSTYTTLDDPLRAADGFTNPLGISGGNIVGLYFDASYGIRGFLYNGSTYTTLDDPLIPNAIDGNTIVGYYDDESGSHGFVATVPEPSGITSLLAPAIVGLVVCARLRRRRRSLSYSAAAFAALVLFSSAITSRAVAKNWADSTANWSPGTWSPAGAPVSGEAVNIDFNDGLARTVTLNVSPPSLGLMTIDLTGPFTGASALSMPNNNALTANALFIGGYNGITSTQTAGRGAVTESAGTTTINTGDLALGYGPNSTGTYTLDGTGALTSNSSEYVGLFGNGTFNQSAGTNTIANNTHFFDSGTYAGSSGTYNLSGTGTLTVNTSEYVGDVGTGTFNQDGGTHTIHGINDLYLGFGSSGAGGTYTLSAGTLSVAWDELVGHKVSGTFNQTGGTHTVGSQLRIGGEPGSMGTYTLSSTGSLTASQEIVGYSGTATFVQTGGTNTASSIYISGFSGGNGTYTLSAGQVSISSGMYDGMYVGGNAGGAYSTGVLTVSGTGVLAVGSVLQVYNTAGTALNLNGGTINTAALNFGGVPALFNWSSGKLNLTQSVTWDSAAAATSTSAAFGPALALGSDQTLTITGDETLGGTGAFSLTLNSGSTHEVTGTLTIATNGTLTQNADSTLNAATIIQAGGTVNGTLHNQAKFTYQSGTFNGRLWNSGMVNLGASFTAGNGVENDGTMIVGPGGTFNTSSLVNDSGAYLVIASAFNGSSLVNNGDLVVINTTVGGPVINNHTVTVVGDVNFNGQVSGPGDFFGAGTAHFNGGLAPGASPANVRFEGGLALADTNTLFIEIGGTTPGSQYDRLTISGTASLAGILNVSTINGFTPSAGQSFDILDWGSVAGTFSALQLPALAGGLTWNASQLYSAGVLSIGLSGDFNANGTVDAADYVAWRKGLGTIYSQSDYDIWRANFGQPGGNGSGVSVNTAIPESASLLQMILTAAGMSTRRRRSS